MSRYFAFLTPAALIWIVLVAFGLSPKDAADWTVIIIASSVILGCHVGVVAAYFFAKENNKNLDYVFSALSALYVFGWIWFLGFPFSLIATILAPSLVGICAFVLHKYFFDYLFPALSVAMVFGLIFLFRPVSLSATIFILPVVGAVAFWVRKRFF